MVTIFRLLGLSLLLATSIASAADVAFYFISIADKGNAILSSRLFPTNSIVSGSMLQG